MITKTYWPKLVNVGMFFFVISFITGCSNYQKHAKEQCEQNMGIILEAARSYRLEQGLPTNAVIDPKKLWGFFKKGESPRCPLGTNEYKPFVYTDGPRCPNTPDLHKVSMLAK